MYHVDIEFDAKAGLTRRVLQYALEIAAEHPHLRVLTMSKGNYQDMCRACHQQPHDFVVNGVHVLGLPDTPDNVLRAWYLCSCAECDELDSDITGGAEHGQMQL